MLHVPVASLGWVSPGAATEGVTPYFFLKKLATYFAHHCQFYWFHSGVTPLEGVTRHLFYLSDLVCHLFFCKFVHKFFFFGCHPLDGVTRGGPPAPISGTTVMPPKCSQWPNQFPFNSTASAPKLAFLSSKIKNFSEVEKQPLPQTYPRVRRGTLPPHTIRHSATRSSALVPQSPTEIAATDSDRQRNGHVDLLLQYPHSAFPSRPTESQGLRISTHYLTATYAWTATKVDSIHLENDLTAPYFVAHTIKKYGLNTVD